MPKPRKRKQATPFEKMLGVHGTVTAQISDMFTNAPARMGFGTPSLGQGAEYNLIRISYDYWQLITLFRNHWISRRIVEVPAQDMVKAWPRLTSEISPKDITRIDRALRRTNTKNNVLTGLTWGRLFGGAGGLIVIDGQENELDQPLDLESIKIGSYKGIIPFDRWAGISPLGDVCTDINRPLDFNKPEMYEARVTGGSSFKVHSSRLLRFLGPTVPTPEVEAQSYWGISVLEPTYESITMLDNMYWNILSLSFRANLLGMKFPELAQLLSGLGSSQVASQKFEQRMSAINHLMSNNSLIPLPAEGSIESTQYSFGGLDGVLQLFQLNLAGAAQMPITRLFGRTYNGLGQAGDGDEKIYEEKISTDQATYMVPQLEKLYPVICMSELGEVPEDLDLVCPSIRVLDEKDKVELAKATADTLTVYLNGGIMSPRRVGMEVKQTSDITGIGTNLDDEFIEKLSDDVQSEGEMGEGLFGGEGGLNPSSGPAKVIKEENKQGEENEKAAEAQQQIEPEPKKEEADKKAALARAGEAQDIAPAMDTVPSDLRVGERVLVNGKQLTVRKVTTGTKDLFGDPTVQVMFDTGEIVAYRPRQEVTKAADEKPTTHIQGKVIVEFDGYGYMVMLPDGHVHSALTKQDVLRITNRYAKKHAVGDVNALIIEWRGGQANDEEAKWEEAKHPRADNGQFGSGGGGASSEPEYKGVKKGKHKTATSLAEEMLGSKKFTDKDVAEACNKLFGTKFKQSNINFVKNKMWAATPEGKAAMAAQKAAIKANSAKIAAAEKNPVSQQQLNAAIHQATMSTAKTMYVSAKDKNGKAVYYKVSDIPDGLNTTENMQKMMQAEGLTVVNSGQFDPAKPAPAIGYTDMKMSPVLAQKYKDEELKKAAELAALHQPVSDTEDLSPDMKTALESYTDGSYRQLNIQLRSGQPLSAEQATLAAHIDKALRNSKISKDTTTYRGIKEPAKFFGASVKIGTVLVDNGFISTSKNQAKAEGFKGSGGLIAKIKLPKGSSGMDVSPLSLHSSEKEVLLPRGSMFKVVGFANGVVELEYVTD